MFNALMDSLRELIFRARTSRGMSQAAFGALVGVHERTIGNLELGKTSGVKLKNVPRLAEVLGVAPDALIAMFPERVVRRIEHSTSGSFTHRDPSGSDPQHHRTTKGKDTAIPADRAAGADTDAAERLIRLAQANGIPPNAILRASDMIKAAASQGPGARKARERKAAKTASPLDEVPDIDEGVDDDAGKSAPPKR
jgi:transcriptional regulator with XRE-family HTH domain